MRFVACSLVTNYADFLDRKDFFFSEVCHMKMDQHNLHLLIHAANIRAVDTNNQTKCCFTSCREDVLLLFSYERDGNTYGAHNTIIIMQ